MMDPACAAREAQGLASSQEIGRRETQHQAKEAEGENGKGEKERDRPDRAVRTICTSSFTYQQQQLQQQQ